MMICDINKSTESDLVLLDVGEAGVCLLVHGE